MNTYRVGKLLFVCGKMAAGKSTLCTELAAREDAVLVVQDDLLGALYPGEFVDLAAFVKYSNRLQRALTPHIVALLTKGISVVLDFGANTKRQRAWYRDLIETSDCDHELHFIVASDELCKRQLRKRSQERGLSPGAKWTTEADFEAVTAYFDPPAADEGFNVIRHERHEPRTDKSAGPPPPDVK
jgi:predicted kinase